MQSGLNRVIYFIDETKWILYIALPIRMLAVTLCDDNIQCVYGVLPKSLYSIDTVITFRNHLNIM